MKFDNTGDYSPFNPEDARLNLRFQHETQNLKVVFDTGTFSGLLC